MRRDPGMQEDFSSTCCADGPMEGEGRQCAAALLATRGALYGLRWPLALVFVLIVAALLWDAWR